MPELVYNYSDMPIQRHDCKNSVFLPAEKIKQNQWRGGSAALSILQIDGIFAKNEPNQYAFALCLPELHITLASPALYGVYPDGSALLWPFASGF